jgi:hypothetical protein
MKKLLGLALGIIASLGGFVDTGDLVFGKLAKMLGWGYFAIICIVSAAAMPLMILTGRGH